MRSLIRRAVLATSVPPLLGVYRSAYSLAKHLAVRLFRRYGAVKAIYLCRGGARGAILPLVSDLDFTIVAEGLTADDRAELLAAYGALARRTTILDSVVEIHDEASMRAKFEENDYFRYRFFEGRTSWRLLWGRDYIAELPEPSRESMTGPYLAELRVWWGVFAQRLLQGEKYEREVVPRNAICYKAAAETLRMIIALDSGELPASREDAIARSTGGGVVDPRDAATLDRLARLARRRFRDRDAAIIDDTLALLVRALDAFFARFAATNPYGRAVPGVAMAAVARDASAETYAWRADAAAEQLAQRAATAAPLFARSTLLPAAYFDIDTTLVFAPIDLASPPRASELRAAIAAIARAEGRERVALYILGTHAAFRIDGRDPTMSWQTIVNGPMNPDVWSALGRSAPAWTPAVAHFVAEERGLFAAARRDPTIYKIAEIDFLRLFWKTAQLALLERTVARGAALTAYTPAAIARGLAESGAPLPPALEPLVGARALAGAPAARGDSASARDGVSLATTPDLRPLRRAAIDYLDAIAPGHSPA
ncbi:MAG: hypothetical protein ACKVU1_13540 [bacterium]